MGMIIQQIWCTRKAHKYIYILCYKFRIFGTPETKATRLHLHLHLTTLCQSDLIHKSVNRFGSYNCSHAKASLSFCVCWTVCLLSNLESVLTTESIGMHQNYQRINFVNAQVKKEEKRKRVCQKEKNERAIPGQLK